MIEATLYGTEAVHCVAGAAGMGNTSLMQRIVEMRRARSIIVLNGSFVDGQGLPPLWHWRRILTKVKNVAARPAARFVRGMGNGSMLTQ